VAPDRPQLEALPEERLNALLRRVDWRFLLDGEGAPLVANLVGGEDARAIELVGADGEPGPGGADLAAIGFPSRRALRSALQAVRPGGAVVSLSRRPRPLGAARAAARMRRAGLRQVRVFWAGPLPHRAPQFWLDLDSEAATAGLLAQRPPSGAAQALLRPLWRACARAGLLTPLVAIGRAAGGEERGDEIDATLPAAGGRLLLSGGKRSINKVVGFPFAADEGPPKAIAKFARVAAADAALEREAAVLRAVERDHPDVPGVPRLLAEGRRAGRHALAESAVHGEPLLGALTEQSFGELAPRVGNWLAALAGNAPGQREEWWSRLVDEPLTEFERNFGGVVAADSAAELRRRLELLGDLPGACEHRDCSPWNVVLDREGAPGLHDWESAEPRGLPGLDLAYFLANCAFILDGALDSGRTRESYARLLDPTTPHGTVATTTAERYCAATGISTTDYARLRLLCWLIHTASDHQHLTMAAAGPPSPEALRQSSFLGLLEVELEPRGRT
jgi:hypothetical protein